MILGLTDAMKWKLAGVLAGGLMVAMGWQAPVVLAARQAAAATASSTPGTGASRGSVGATGGTGSVASGTSVAGATAASAAAATEAVKPGNGTVESANVALKGADANAALLAQIAKLPALVGTGIDVPKRSAEIVTHFEWGFAVLPDCHGAGAEGWRAE